MLITATDPVRRARWKIDPLLPRLLSDVGVGMISSSSVLVDGVRGRSNPRSGFIIFEVGAVLVSVSAGSES